MTDVESLTLCLLQICSDIPNIFPFMYFNAIVLTNDKIKLVELYDIYINPLKPRCSYMYHLLYQSEMLYFVLVGLLGFSA
jgi:hypothetical protein